jgi:putative tricarboxylic transport membrane protein
MPAVKEGHALFMNGNGSLALSGAALGSVFGSFFAVVLVFVCMPFAVEAIMRFYNNQIQLGIFLAVTFFILVYNDRPRWENMLLFAFGMFLGKIGESIVPIGVFMPELIPYETFPDLLVGLPLFPVILALFVVPVLINNSGYDQTGFDTFKEKIRTLPIIEHIKNYKQHWMAGIRGSVLGSFFGLVPHLNNTIASNFSYSWEKRRRLRNGTYEENGDMASLISAETANNSSTFLTLMPLVLLGIPITTSEAILVHILDRSAIIVDYSTTIATGLFNELTLYFVLCNLVALVLAWPMVSHLHYMYKLPLKWLFAITMAVLLALLVYMGDTYGTIAYYVWTFVVLAPIGYLLRKTDTLVIILAFVLSDKVVGAMYRFYIIYG